MSKKLSSDEAVKVMKDAKLEPLTNYPGRLLPWKSKCLQCGKVVSPSVAAVKTNGGGCKTCGIKRSADSRRLDEKNLILKMKKAGVTPLEPYVGISKPWLCKCLKCKREVSPTYGNVRNGHAACVYCVGRKVHPDDAEIIMRKAGLEPLVPYPGSNTKWKCIHLKCGVIVYPMYGWIVAGQGGCQKCGYLKSKQKQSTPQKKAIAFFKSKGLVPLEPYPGGGKPWKSKCNKCGEITSPHYRRVKSGTGCGVCAGKIVPPARAVAEMKAVNLEPLEPYPGSKTKWKCKCLKCGVIVYPKYGDIKQGDGGCKYCGGHYVGPDIVFKTMVAKGANPQNAYKSSGAKWHCICQICKRDIYPSWDSVRGGSAPCGYCARRKIVPKEAKEKMILAGAKPLVRYPGARNAWECRCLKCKRIVFPYYGSVINEGQSPCPYCAGKKVDPDSAFKLMVNAGLNPLVKYISANAPWPCTCEKCGKKVSPTYSSIRIGQGGCRYCTNKGLDYNSPAFLYLMTHQEFRAHKVGVGNHKTRNNRIKEHIKTGWILIKNMDFQTGDDAFKVEQETLVWLREVKKLGIYLSSSEMPQGGETETVDASEIDLPTIWAKVEEFSEKQRLPQILK